MKRTAKQLIYDAMRLIGYIRAGVTPSTEAYADGLDVLNEMLDSWNTERLNLLATRREVFDVVAGQATYEIGPGGDWDTTRPTRIEHAGILQQASGVLELPMRILTVQQWAEKPLKGTTSTLARELYYDEEGCVSLWPVPSVGEQIALYMWGSLCGFHALTSSAELKPGYAKAIKYNLAVDLAPRFNIVLKDKRPLHALVIETAIKSKAAIQALNAPRIDLGCDDALLDGRSRFDWRTGE